MSDPVIFQIEEGVLAFELVDREAVGYADTWQAPAGVEVDAATTADYDAGSAGWSCQATSGMLTSTQDTTTTDVPATFCSPAKTVPQPAETSYSLEVEFLQDPTVVNGLSMFLFEHDTEECYFLLGLQGEAAPKAIGRVRLGAGAIGGPARQTLTATVSLPLSKKPQILFGQGATVEAVPALTP